MKHNLNEVKRMQQLAGILNESQLNEADHLTEIRQLVKEVIKEYLLNEDVFNGKEYMESGEMEEFLEDEIRHTGEITPGVLFVKHVKSMTGPRKGFSGLSNMDPALDAEGNPIVYKTVEPFVSPFNRKKGWKSVRMKLVRETETINEVIKSGVREMWADIKDALANARTVTVDDIEVEKAISGAGAVRGVDGKIYRIQSPEYLSQPERIKIKDANGEMKSPVISLYSDDEVNKIANDYMDRTGGKFMGPESYIDPESMFYRGGD